MHYIHSKTGGTSHFTGGTIYIPILLKCHLLKFYQQKNKIK
jgi:hypothetical protein